MMKLLIGILISLIAQFVGIENQNWKTINSSKKIDSATYFYSYSNDTIIQKIKIYQVGNKMEYWYDVINRKRHLTEHRQGTAIKAKSLNLEFGEDEAGNPYPVDIYDNKKGSCWFSIFIERDKKTMVTILETNQCFEKKPFVPIKSIGILRKQKKSQ